MGRDSRWRECYWFLVLLHGVGSLAAASAGGPQLPLVVNTWAFKNANEIGATSFSSVLGWGGINVVEICRHNLGFPKILHPHLPTRSFLLHLGSLWADAVNSVV